MSRSSTAQPASQAFLDVMFGRLRHGPALNVGAGVLGYHVDRIDVVNVDHVAPSATSAASFVVADINRLPFQAATFRGILMKDVLEHVPDAITLLKEVRRVAAGDASMVLIVPRAIPRAVWDDPTHVRGFTARALVSAVGLGGWRPVRGPRRIGGLPGAERLGLVPWLEEIMLVPGLGHWFGTNWILEAVAA